MVGNVIPEALSTFGPEITVASLASTRVHLTLLNAKRGIFADKAVREATSFGVDRAALLRVALGGQGEALSTIFAKSSGFDQAPLPTFDTAKARQLLDAAGWVPSGDGVRAKGGTRLAFTLLSYPGRPELTQMAVAMQAQLKSLGYDMQVREIQQIDPELQKAEYDASMYSVNTLITGDPLYFYNVTLGNTAIYNYAKYEIPGMEALLAQLRDESDPARRQAISRQVQEIVRVENPIIYIAAAPKIFAYRKDKLRDFVPHPNDLYLFDATLKVS
jgi:peptide/nickel transport system substrate-binding protein